MRWRHHTCYKNKAVCLKMKYVWWTTHSARLGMKNCVQFFAHNSSQRTVCDELKYFTHTGKTNCVFCIEHGCAKKIECDFINQPSHNSLIHLVQFKTDGSFWLIVWDHGIYVDHHKQLCIRSRVRYWSHSFNIKMFSRLHAGHLI